MCHLFFVYTDNLSLRSILSAHPPFFKYLRELPRTSSTEKLWVALLFLSLKKARVLDRSKIEHLETTVNEILIKAKSHERSLLNLFLASLLPTLGFFAMILTQAIALSTTHPSTALIYFERLTTAGLIAITALPLVYFYYELRNSIKRAPFMLPGAIRTLREAMEKKPELFL